VATSSYGPLIQAAGDQGRGSLRVAEYRRRLKEQIGGNRLETFGEALLLVIARVASLTSIGKKKVTYARAAAILFLSLFCTTSSIALLLVPLQDMGLVLAVHAWGAGVATLQLLSSRYYSRLLRETIVKYVIDSISSLADLRDLAGWVEATFDKRRQLGMSLAIGGIASILGFVGVFVTDHEVLLNPGTILLSVVGWFLGATGWYFLIPGVTLGAHLAKYKLALFSPDPAHSELIGAVCHMMHRALFVAVAIATLFTSGVFLLGTRSLRLQIAFSVVCAWGPLVICLSYYQYCLFKVIRNAKRAALGPLELAVLDLQSRVQLLDAVLFDRLNKLLDLHKRIRESNATALDWRGSLATINTLLLPLISFLVAHSLSVGGEIPK
jgi:hypothetical protein